MVIKLHREKGYYYCNIIPVGSAHATIERYARNSFTTTVFIIK